jgi:hypothetical protein
MHQFSFGCCCSLFDPLCQVLIGKEEFHRLDIIRNFIELEGFLLGLFEDIIEVLRLCLKRSLIQLQ